MISKVKSLLPLSNHLTTTRYFSSNVSQLTTDLIEEGKISEGKTFYGKPFPLVLQPKERCNVNFLQLQEYFQKNDALILKAASEYGAILFKDFDVKSGEEWASILYKTGLKEQVYEGHGVRKLIVGTPPPIRRMQVVSANESPYNIPIHLHHELAYSPEPSSHINIFCQLPASEGGSTPIMRSDVIYDFILEKYPELAKKFEGGIKYTKRIPEINDPSSSIGKSWKDTFGVNTREETDAILKKNYNSWEWIKVEDGTHDLLFTTKICPGLGIGSNSRQTFFNQAYAAHFAWTLNKLNKDVKTVKFADNSEVPIAFWDDLNLFIDQNKVSYKWKAGEFFFIDNSIAQHGREVFKGRRQVYASLARGFKEKETEEISFTLSNGEILQPYSVQVNDECHENPIKKWTKFINTSYKNRCEQLTGNYIKNAIDHDIIKRRDLFVSGKLWNTYHRKDKVKEACKMSLHNMGLHYFDLYSVHYPIALQLNQAEQLNGQKWDRWDSNLQDSQIIEDNVPFQETWQAMEELVKEGLVLNIGVDNIGVQLLRDVLTYAKIKPSVVQVEMHPYLQQDNLVNYCRQNGIAVFSNNPFGNSEILKEDVVKQLSKEIGVSPESILIRWLWQRGAGVILDANHSSANLNAAKNINLTTEQMENLTRLPRKRFEQATKELQSQYRQFVPIYDD